MAIARTTTVDLVRSARKVREYFEEQLREGRNSWINQSDYLLRPLGVTSSSTASTATAATATASSSTASTTTRGASSVATAAVTESSSETLTTGLSGHPRLGFNCSEASVCSLLQRHWQRPMLEAIRVCLIQLGAPSPANLCVRRRLHGDASAGTRVGTSNVDHHHDVDDDFDDDADDNSPVPPVLGGSLQLAGNTLVLACFAGTFRSAPDWAVFNMQHPTIW